MTVPQLRNDAAMRIVKVIYPNLLDVGCFSHTLDLIGEHFHTGLSMQSYSATRWWSRWEVYKQMMVQFGDLEEFLKSNSEISDVSPASCCPFLLTPQKKLTCKLN